MSHANNSVEVVQGILTEMRLLSQQSPCCTFDAYLLLLALQEVASYHAM